MLKRILLAISCLILTVSLFAGDKEEGELDVQIPVDKEETQKKNLSENRIEEKTGNSEEKTSQFKGKFLASVAAKLNDKQQFQFNYDKLQLEYKQLLGNITFHLKGNARYNSVYNNDRDVYFRGENLRFDLQEATVNIEAAFDKAVSQLSLKTGIQTINWGKADEFRPTDILSPQDFSLFYFEERNERKFGRFAVKANVFFGESLNFEAIWLPLQRSSEMTMDPSSPFTMPGVTEIRNVVIPVYNYTYTIRDLILPEQKLSHSDLALKANLNVLGADLSFSFYNGYDTLPYSRVTFPYHFTGSPIIPIAIDGAPSLQPFLNRVTMWGFDFEKAFLGIVFRGEAAYYSKGMLFAAGAAPLNADLTVNQLFVKYSNGFAEKDFLDATIGFDKTDLFISKLYLNLQYSVNHIYDYEDGLKNRYGTKTKATNHMLIYSISWETPKSLLKFDFGGNYNFSQQDFLLNPKVSIKAGPETRFELGAYFFEGDKDTLIGQFTNQDYGYLKLEHLF